MPSKFRRLAVASLAACLPVMLHAQLLVSTGASVTGGLDNRWQINGNPTAAVPPWSAASVVTSPPGQWTSGAPGGTWISVNPSATGGSGTYAIRTLFTLNTGDLLSFRFRCANDNGVVSLFINGSAAPGSSPCPDLWSWGSFVTLTQSAFTVGQNSLEFRWTGDRTTDGMAVQISDLSYTPSTPPTPGVVPEPTTYALMGTGLFGLAMFRRRRRVG